MILVLVRLAILMLLLATVAAGLNACHVPLVLKVPVMFGLGWCGAAWAYQGLRQG